MSHCVFCDRDLELDEKGRCADCAASITKVAEVLRTPPFPEDALDQPLFPGLMRGGARGQ